MNELTNLWGLKTLSDTKKHLKTVSTSFHKLKTLKEKNAFIREIKRVCADCMFSSCIDDLFSEKKTLYTIYNKNQSFRFLLTLMLFQIDKAKNFDSIMGIINDKISEYCKISSSKHITEKEIKMIFDILYEKYPNLKKVLTKIKLNILLFNISHKEFDSECATSKDLSTYYIYSYYMKDDDTDIYYVFLHEVGHMICWLMTKELDGIPNNFLKEIGCYPELESDNPDAREVFADSFAMATMYNTALEANDPFKQFVQINDYKDLERYFKREIDLL